MTDDGGATSVPDTVTVTALPGPTATIDGPGQDTTITLGDSITFAGSASDPDGTIQSHAWDFDDGGTSAVEDPGAHLYGARGVHVVTYRVTDDDGVTSAPDSVTVTVNEPPMARIDQPGRDTTARWPYAIEFSGTAGDADGTVAQHLWDFGDGYTTDDADPGPYAYAAPGTYTVTYRTTDNDGAVSEPGTVVVTVEEWGIAPEPGGWLGWPAFGLDFHVSDRGTAIPQVSFMFEDWRCGADTLDERITASQTPGWAIENDGFTIATTFPELDLTMTVDGAFTSGTEASGTWTAVLDGTTCSGAWQAQKTPPTMTVVKSVDFSRTLSLLGFNWLPGRQLTLAIYDADDGALDFIDTTRVSTDGMPRFDWPGGVIPAMEEGDSVVMHDAVMATGYVVLYVTVASVNPDLDLVSGNARPGTAVGVWINNPIPWIGGPSVNVVAGVAGWTASFAGIYDIVPGTTLVVSALCDGIWGGMRCGGSTSLNWP